MSFVLATSAGNVLVWIVWVVAAFACITSGIAVVSFRNPFYSALALIGIFMAILLVFVELGFFYAVPRGGLLLYDNMRFDLLLASNEYEFQAQPGSFPLSQLDPIRTAPQVQAATPIYFGFGKWKSGAGGLWPDVFVIGFDPASHIFAEVTLDGDPIRPSSGSIKEDQNNWHPLQHPEVVIPNVHVEDVIRTGGR